MAKPSRSHRPKARSPFRLALESLEERALPSGGPVLPGVAPGTEVLAKPPAEINNFNPGLVLTPSGSAAPAPGGLVATPGYVVANRTNLNLDGTQKNTLAPTDFGGPYGQGYAPYQLQAAYGFNQLSFLGGNYNTAGAGQTIAIVDAYDDPNITADLQTFDTTLGITGSSGNSSDTSFFKKVSQTGGSTSGITADAGWAVEISLDVEWAHAMAPGANILLVEANSNSYSDLFTGVQYAASVRGVSVVSMSFGGGEDQSIESEYDSVFTTPTGHLDGNGNPGGVTFVASTGDGGAPGGYPADSPNVLAVGGTSLTLAATTNAIVSETGWSGSGGGISAFETQPAYQDGVQAALTAEGNPSNGYRTIPDVAYVADPNTGVDIQDSFENPYYNVNGWTQIGGTSDAAPQWASLIAIADQYRVAHGDATMDGPTQTLPTLYSIYQSHPGDFNDITSGSNGYPAAPGYDLVTGLGTPVVQNLVPAFAPDLTVVATSPAAGSFVGGAPTSVTVQFSDPITPGSVNLTDFQLDGVSPNSDTSSGANGLTLIYNTSPVTQEGPQTFTVLQGAVTRQRDGSPVDAFSDTFYYTPTQLQETSISPSTGSIFNLPGDLYVHFNEAVNPATVSTSNLVLSEGAVTAASVVGGDPTTVDYKITAPSADDGTTVTVTLANGTLTDLYGDPGLGFSASFTANVLVAPYPVPLTPEPPLGGLVYDPTVSGKILFVGDSSSFTIALNAGQTASVTVKPDASLQALVGIYDSHGHPVSNTAAAAPGQEVLLQTVPITKADTYTILVQGDANTTGAFTVQLVLNAALEVSANGGTPGSDATSAGAQDLTPAFTALSDGGSRAAVVGQFSSSLAAGDVFVSERGGPGVVLLDNSGNVLAKFTDPSLSAGAIQFVSLGANNDVYVGVDTTGGTGQGGEVVHFNSGGTLLGTIALPAINSGGYYYPYGFTVAADGSLWVAGAGSGYVEHLSATGATIQSYYTGGIPEAVAVRSDGQVFVSNYGYGDIQQLDPTSGNVSTYAYTYYGEPQGLNFAPNGDLVVADVYDIEYFNGSGSYPYKYVFDDYVADAQVDASGNTFATNYFYDRVDEFGSGGNLLSSTPLSGVPIGVAIVGVGISPTPPVASSSAYYSFTLTKGESATVAVAQLQGSGATIDLENGSGTVLALAHAGTNGVTGAIDDFVAPAAGTYYVHVTRATSAPVQYDVVVTTGSDFGTGPNQSLTQPQNIAGEAGVLGYAGSTVDNLETFDSGSSSLNAYTFLGSNNASVIAAAAHDGPYGLSLASPTEWMYRDDAGDQVQQGDVISAWVQSVGSAGANDGRAYFGFGASAAGTLSLVMAPNSGQLILQDNTSYGFTDLAAVSQSWQANHWYRFVITWGTDGTITGQLFDSDGKTLLNTVTAQDDNIKSGGIAFRAFGSTKYFDTVQTGATDANYYTISAKAGNALSLSTTTPGSSGSGQFQNSFEPKLVLYSPTGTVVASAENNASDGLNAVLKYTVPTAGTYTVEVLESDLTATPTSGEYVLGVSGATGAATPFTVASTTPAANAIVFSLTTVTVDFSSPIYLPSLTAGALTVDGVAATGFTVNNDHEVVFTLPTLSATGHDVKHAIQIGNSIKDLQGVALTKFTENVYVDNLPPEVSASSIAEGAEVTSGTSVTYKVTFNDPINTSVITAASFDLHGVYYGVDYQPASYSFDSTRKVLTIKYANLPDDVYKLTLFSQEATDGGPVTNANGFENIVDTALDGEPNSAFPSGDGTAGGNFVVDFRVDTESNIAFPTPLQAVAPIGSQVYQGSTTNVITTSPDADTFTLKLDAGQTVTLTLVPDASLQAQIGFNGQTASAAAAGSEVVLETVPVGSAGTYKFTVTGLNGTLGLYTLTVTLNAAVANPGAPNAALATAQDLTAAFTAQAGKGARAAALGATGPAAYYSFPATAGQSLSLGVLSDTGGATLELFDASGNQLALGTGGATNYDQTLSNFVARYTGTYYVEVAAASGTTFNLVVTRGLALDIESNNTQATAQDITATTGAKGGGAVGAIYTAPLPPAVLYYSDYSTQNVYTQAFAALKITPTVATSFYDFETKLASGTWSLVVLDNAGYFDTSWVTPLANYVDAGGRAILDSWVGGYYPPYVSAAAAAFGASYTGNTDYASITQTVTTSPIWTGISNPYPLGNPDFFGIYSDGLTATTGQSIGQFANGDSALVVGNSGRTILNGFIQDAVSSVSQAVLLAENEVSEVLSTVPPAAPLPDPDWYSVNAKAGDTLKVSVTVPGGGSGQFPNTLAPVVTLYDSSGDVLATSNTSFSYKVPAGKAGAYYVLVAGSPGTQGEYALSVTGETGAVAPVTVVAVNPAPSALLQPPNAVTVTFSQPIDLATLSASELTVKDLTHTSQGTMTATSFTPVNDHEVTWYLPGVFNGSAENNQLQLAGGLIQDVSGAPLAAYTENYTTDNVPPRVVTTSIQEGNDFPVGAGSLTYIVSFSAKINASNITSASFDLHGDDRGADYTPSSFSFDSTGTVLTINYVGLPNDAYTLTLFSTEATDGGPVTNPNGFADLVGNALDGEPHSPFTLPSGDGTAGGNFYVDFGLTAGTQYFPRLQPVNPLGSLVYQGSASTVLVSPTDVDTFTLNLAAGQTVTINDTSGTLQGQVELVGPGGTVVAEASASVAGGSVLLQTEPLASSGVYSIVVSGLNGTTGLVTTQVTLNAALQNEAGGGNHALATAQDLTSSFETLGVHGASRGAVLGAATPSGVVSGDVWVALSDPAEVALYDNNLNLLTTITNSALDTGTLSAVHIAADGTLYVGVDTTGAGNGGELVHLDTNGNLLGIIDLPDDADYGEKYPLGFAVAPDGTLWVVQENNGDVIHITNTGTLIRSYSVGGAYGYPVDVAVRADGQVFVADPVQNGGEVEDLDPTTGNVTIFGSFGDYLPEGVSFAGPGGTGDLLVSNYYYYVFYYNSTGGLDQYTYVGGYNASDKAETDLSGNLFTVSTSSLYASKYSSSGFEEAFTYLANYPTSVAVVGVDGPAPESNDFYSFTLSANQDITIAATSLNGGPVTVTLEDASGDVLATGTTVGTNVTNVISNFDAGAAGTYSVDVTSAATYSLVVTRSADFSVNPNGNEADAQNLGATTGELGAITVNTPNGSYFYESIGDNGTITLTTSTPNGGPGGFTDHLLPSLELLNSSGTVVATGTTLSDGVNQTLTYTVPVGQGGIYYVVVTGQNGTTGEYYLDDPVTYPTVAAPAPAPLAQAIPVDVAGAPGSVRSAAGVSTPGAGNTVAAAPPTPLGAPAQTGSVPTRLAGSSNGAVAQLTGTATGQPVPTQVALAATPATGLGTTPQGDAPLPVTFSQKGIADATFTASQSTADDGWFGAVLTGDTLPLADLTSDLVTDDADARNVLFGATPDSSAAGDDLDSDGLAEALLGSSSSEGTGGGE